MVWWRCSSGSSGGTGDSGGAMAWSSLSVIVYSLKTS